MSNLFSLFIVGFTAAALPGAVQTTVFLVTIEGDIRSGLKLALGAAMMDGLYLSLACLGLVSFIGNFPVLRIGIGLGGVIFMVYLGVQGIRQAWIGKTINAENKKSGGFLTGFLLVLLHIPTMLYFIGVAGTMCRENTSVSSAISGAASLFVGAFVCFVCVAFIAWLSKRFGGKVLIRVLQIGSAVILIIFAIKTFISLFSV